MQKEDVTQKTNIRRQSGLTEEDSGIQKMNTSRQNGSSKEIDAPQEEFRQKHRIREDTRALWKELQHEAKLGLTDIKLTNKDEDKKVVEYIRSHKTKDTYAFSREEISNATGIPLSILPYTTIIKIPNIRFVLFCGKLSFTTITLKERLIEFF